MEEDIEKIKERRLSEVKSLREKLERILLLGEKVPAEEPSVDDQARQFEEAGKRELSRIERESQEKFFESVAVIASVLGLFTLIGAILAAVLKK